MDKYLFSAVLAMVELLSNSSARATACPGTRPTNGFTADAGQVMDWMDCKAPLDAPRFSGNVGIGTAMPGAPLSFGSTTSSEQVLLTYEVGTYKRGIGNDISGALGGFETSIFTVESGSNVGGITLGKMSTGDGTTFTPLLTIRNSGNIGIGTTAPVPADGSAHTLQIGSNMILQNVVGNQVSLGNNVFFDGTGWFTLSTGQSSDMRQYNGDIAFHTHGSVAGGTNIGGAWDSSDVKLIIKNGGNVGIGTTAPSYTLQVNGSVAGTGEYNNLSDVRLKKNIRHIEEALSIIERLQGVRFDWRLPKERPVGKSFNLPLDAHQVGFVAQDVRKALPEAVTVASGPEEIMSIQESKIIPVLVEAIKELKADSQNQMSEIRRLRTENGGELALIRAQLRELQQQPRFRTAQN